MTAKIFSLTAIAITISGCAVPSAEIQHRYNQAETNMARQAGAASEQRLAEPVMVRMSGNFVTGVPVELGYKSKLPAAFRDVTLRFADAPSLSVVAQRITEATRLPVAIHSDALGASSSTATGNPGSAPNAATQAIPMDFRGNLADFLDILCAQQGLGWSYNSGTIDISRYVTRTFQLAASPGSVSYGSRVAKGSTASTGSTGSANSQATGSFTGTTDSALETSKLSPWEPLKASITSILTPTFGRVTLNEATGTVVVTDTRMVVDQVARLVELENNLLTRQMALQVEILTLQADDETQAEIDANVIYKALNGNWGINASAAGSLATAQTSSLTFGILQGRGSGTNLVAKALNGVGRVTQNMSTTLVTTNRVPIPLAQFQTTGYLASTAPATGGGTSGGVGVPGLTPGSVTTGLFLSALPTILDNNTLLLRLSIDTSTLQSLESTSTGNGATFQQIQYPNVTGYKSDHHVTLRAGDSLVLVGVSNDGMSGHKRDGLLSRSVANKRSQAMQVIIVTPRIQAGA